MWCARCGGRAAAWLAERYCAATAMVNADTSSRAETKGRERPLVHIRTRICASDPVPLKPATLLPSSPTICRSGILKRLMPSHARQRYLTANPASTGNVMPVM